MAASFVTFLFLSAQSPSPERIISESMEKFCHTCETLLTCVLRPSCRSFVRPLRISSAREAQRIRTRAPDCTENGQLT